MWYIIAIEPHDFLELKVSQDEVNFKFQGKENGVPIFNVSEGDKYFSIEVYDDEFEPYYLNELYKLDPSGFVCINHTTVLLRWGNDVEKLYSNLKNILHTKDKYAVFKVSEVIASNFLPVDYINQQLNK